MPGQRSPASRSGSDGHGGLLATVLIRDSWAAVVGWVFVLAGFVVKLGQEERLLSSALGAEYSKYQSDVAALVPGVW